MKVVAESTVSNTKATRTSTRTQCVLSTPTSHVKGRLKTASASLSRVSRRRRHDSKQKSAKYSGLWRKSEQPSTKQGHHQETEAWNRISSASQRVGRRQVRQVSVGSVCHLCGNNCSPDGETRLTKKQPVVPVRRLRRSNSDSRLRKNDKNSTLKTSHRLQGEPQGDHKTKMKTSTSCQVRLDVVARHAGSLTPQVSAIASILPLWGEQGSNKGARKRRHLEQKLFASRQRLKAQVKSSHQTPQSAISCRLEQPLQQQHRRLTSKPAKTSTHSRLCRQQVFKLVKSKLHRGFHPIRQSRHLPCQVKFKCRRDSSISTAFCTMRTNRNSSKQRQQAKAQFSIRVPAFGRRKRRQTLVYGIRSSRKITKHRHKRIWEECIKYQAVSRS